MVVTVGKELYAAAREGDGEAISILVEKHQGLVYFWAKKHATFHPKFDFEDLAQEGSIGLLRAITLYNPKKFKTRFSTYASFWIKNLIQRFIKLNRNQVYIPLHVDDFITSSVLSKSELTRQTLGIKKGKMGIRWLHNFTAFQLRVSENSTEPIPENFGGSDYDNSLRELLIFGIKKHIQEEEYKRLALYHYGLEDGKIKTLEETARKFRKSREWVRLTLLKINPLMRQLVP